MADLNIRGMKDDEYHAVKVAAARERKTIRDWVIEILVAAAAAVERVAEELEAVAAPKKAKLEPEAEERPDTPCPSCGAVCAPWGPNEKLCKSCNRKFGRYE
jgi:plasmid stability protein